LQEILYLKRVDSTLLSDYGDALGGSAPAAWASPMEEGVILGF
jgi:hypothetical protein